MSAQETIATLRAPPHSIEAEQAVLGAVMIDNGVLAEIGSRLQPDMFYRREHRLIYSAMLAIGGNRKPIDMLTLCDALTTSGQIFEAGGVDYVATVFESTLTSSNAAHYAEIVRSKHLERSLIRAAHSIADQGYNGTEPVEERIAAAQAALLGILDSAPDGEAVHINDAMRKMVQYLEDRQARGSEMAGLSSGYRDLDRLLGGFKPGEMILVAGRPSMGKSTLAQNFIEHNVLAGKNVLFFSVEMPEVMVTMRHTSSLGKVPLEALMNGETGEHGDGILSAGAKLKDRFYRIDDTPSLTSTQVLLRAQREQMKTGRPLDLIVVDYIQKLRDPGDNQNVRIQEISGNIKHAARVLNCPVIALSQLSRECEKRPNKRPMMSDLRDSGALEQDADVIMFVYRDEVYKENSERAGIAEILVRKNRNGRTGDAFLTSRLEFARFENFGGQLPPREPTKAARGGFDYGE